MNDDDLKDLHNAVKLLENPSLSVKVADVIGTPIEKAIAALPSKAKAVINSATEKAIHKALKVSFGTMEYYDPKSDIEAPKSSDLWHKAATATTGALGGAFGVMALTIELPISTTIMMRSIADIARSEGADMQNIQTQLECVQVLALGGPSNKNNTTEVGYFVTREAMTKAISEAYAHIASHSFKKEGAPAVIKLINRIAERFSLNVTDKVAGQFVPIIGAIGGALINTIFMDHFENMARGHFIILRLENKYGAEKVRQKYNDFNNKMKLD